MILFYQDNQFKLLEMLETAYDVNFKLDETTDTAKLVVFNTKKDIPKLPQDTILRHYLNDGTGMTEWMVRNSKKEIKNTKVCVHNYDLVELIEKTKDTLVESLSYYYGRYTFSTVLSRLSKISKFPFIYDGPDYFDYNPHLVYEEMRLYDILFDIGRTVDRIPKMRFDENTQKYILTFVRMDGRDNQKVYDIGYFDGPTQIEEEVSSTLANKAVSIVKNISAEEVNHWPDAGLGMKASSADGRSSITIGNAVLRLPDKIKEVTELRIFGKYETLSGGDQSLNGKYYYDLYIYFNKDNNFVFNQGIGGGELFLVEQKEHQLLTDESDRNNASIVYKIGDDFIDISKCLYLIGYEIAPIDPERPYIVTYTNMSSILFSVKYIAFSDHNVSESSDGMVEKTVIFNQSTKIADAEKMSRNLDTYINNMKYGDIIRSKHCKNWGQIPEVGSIVKDGNEEYVITSVSAQAKPLMRYDITVQLNKCHARRSERVEADQAIRLPQIPIEEMITRNTLNTNHAIISIDEPLEFKTNDSGVIRSKSNVFMDTLFLSHASTPLIPSMAAIEFKQSPETNFQTIKKLLSPLTIEQHGASIYWGVKARDNRIYMDRNDNGILKPVVYTDELGTFAYCDISIVDSKPANDTMLNLVVDTIPEISNEVFDYYKVQKSILNYDAINYLKDAYERFDWWNQLEFKGHKQTIVLPDYVKDLHMFTRDPSNKSLEVVFLNREIDQYDPIGVSEGTVIAVASVTKINDSLYEAYRLNLAAAKPGLYKSFVIRNATTKKPYLIKNKQSGASTYIDVYFTFKNDLYKDPVVVDTTPRWHTVFFGQTQFNIVGNKAMILTDIKFSQQFTHPLRLHFQVWQSDDMNEWASTTLPYTDGPTGHSGENPPIKDYLPNPMELKLGTVGIVYSNEYGNAKYVVRSDGESTPVLEWTPGDSGVKSIVVSEYTYKAQIHNLKLQMNENQTDGSWYLEIVEATQSTRPGKRLSDFGPLVLQKMEVYY